MTEDKKEQERFRGADLANQHEEHVDASAGPGSTRGVLKGEEASKVREQQEKQLEEEKKIREEREAQDSQLRQADEPKVDQKDQVQEVTETQKSSSELENPDVDVEPVTEEHPKGHAKKK